MKSSPSPTGSARGALLLVLVLAVSALLGGIYGPAVRATAAGSDDLEDSVRSFTHVLSIVEQNYADPVDSDKAIYDGAIPGMLHVLDPHSNFFDPKQYALFREEQEGKYYGVGMVVTQRENQTVVQSPFVNSPAYKAGIRPGDIILKVDGKSCTGLTTTEVADMLKGAKGTPVRISLGREGWDKPIEVTVVRDEIPRPGVEFFTMVRPGIGYVRVSTFNETTDSDLADALRHLDSAKLEGLIIDLRNNGGGLLKQAVGMADMFLDKNELVVSHRGRASSERRYYADRGNQGLALPLVVLVNGQSASASEIVSGAIQDHDRGLIVGEISFGKGLVQTQFQVGSDTALLLTTARYYTPSGRSIQAKGIVPDIVVDDPSSSSANAFHLREADLEHHLINDRQPTDTAAPKDKKPENSDDNKLEDAPGQDKEDRMKPTEFGGKDDYQLTQALNLLKGLNILSKK